MWSHVRDVLVHRIGSNIKYTIPLIRQEEKAKIIKIIQLPHEIVITIDPSFPTIEPYGVETNGWDTK